MGQSHAVDRDPWRERGKKARRGAPVQQDKDPTIRFATDQATKGLTQAQARDAVIISRWRPTRQMDASFTMQDIGTRPWHAFKDNQTQGLSGHIHAVTHGVGPQQA